MNLNALANRPSVSALSQRVSLYPDRELMGLFEHDRKYGARSARAPAENCAALFKLAHYPSPKGLDSSLMQMENISRT
jgi:hypothetical protein